MRKSGEFLKRVNFMTRISHATHMSPCSKSDFSCHLILILARDGRMIIPVFLINYQVQEEVLGIARPLIIQETTIRRR